MSPPPHITDATAPSALRVALLEDDEVLRDRVLVPGLARMGFAVTALGTVEALHGALQTQQFALLVLDVGLPDGDGFEVTQRLQSLRPSMGVVMLSGRSDQPNLVRGLSEGADAYLSKPVDLEVLAATLFSVARRLHRADGGETAGEAGWQLLDGGWCLFAPNGKPVTLTRSERRVLGCLWQLRGRVVSREVLLASAVGDSGLDIDPHRLDALLHRLRQKVLSRTGAALPLRAIRSEGYLFLPAGD